LIASTGFEMFASATAGCAAAAWDAAHQTHAEMRSAIKGAGRTARTALDDSDHDLSRYERLQHSLARRLAKDGLRAKRGFAMNNRFIVATVVFLMLPAQFNNAKAAGLYDGEWKGTARSIGRHCKRASVDFTVEDRVVLGHAKYGGEASNINGTVDESGAIGATIGFQSLKGQFSRDKLQATFKSFDCEWEALLRRTTVANRDVKKGNKTASSSLKGR
jgi:hypothetical protein